jgi:carboxyl-terminal processing protease
VTTPRAALLSACALLTLAFGLWLGGHPARLPGPVRDVFVDSRVAAVDEARGAIDDLYFRAPDGKALEGGSIEGMVRALRGRYHDRFSHYFDPRSYDKFRELTSGQFSGVGLGVNGVKRGLRVAHVFPGSPAARAGIRRGDQVVAVDGHSLAGRDPHFSTAVIRGPAGTTVRVLVLRPSTGVKRELTLKRAEIEVPVVEGSLKRAGGRRVAYVHLATFSRGAHAELRSKIESLYKKGAGGLVLDLRGNGGGLLVEAVLNASVLLPKDEVVVTTSGRKQSSRVYRAVGDPLPRRPTVVLVDGDTASAAEILTAALADHGLATVVGARSFGKGVFQRVIPLDNGGALDLTVGEYLTPKGASLAGHGIDPKVRAIDDPKTHADEGLRSALALLGRKLRS